MATSTALRNKIIAGVGIAAMGGGAFSIAVKMIEPLEGTVRVPYLDVVGVPTVCTGHTGPDIIMGKTYTEAECQALLNKDLRKVATQIDPLIKRPIPDTTRAALYSVTYNIGTSAFKNSTLLKKLNQGDRKGACDEIRRWVYAGGVKWKGLVTRREIERDICLWDSNL